MHFYLIERGNCSGRSLRRKANYPTPSPLNQSRSGSPKRRWNPPVPPLRGPDPSWLLSSTPTPATTRCVCKQGKQSMAVLPNFLRFNSISKDINWRLCGVSFLQMFPSSFVSSLNLPSFFLSFFLSSVRLISLRIGSDGGTLSRDAHFHTLSSSPALTRSNPHTPSTKKGKTVCECSLVGRFFSFFSFFLSFSFSLATSSGRSN